MPIHPSTLVAAALLLAGCARQAPMVTTPIPAALAAPANQKLVLEARAEGVQIYRCKQSAADPSRYEWAFEAPEAELFDAGGTSVAKHYAGPTWEGRDGSKVVGEVRAHVDAPQPGAIPWLLLAAKSNAGSGTFATVKSIQRVNTEGGAAPVGGCPPEMAGQAVRMPYKGVYRFFAG